MQVKQIKAWHHHWAVLVILVILSMPNSQSHAILAGNEFCGIVPSVLDGVVRDLTATIGIHEILTNVTKFNAVCGAESSRSSVSRGAIAGMISMGCYRVAVHVKLHESCQT